MTLAPTEPPRYLVSFDPKRINHRFTDVLVLGSGLAGLRAALSVMPPSSVTLVTKQSANNSSSNWAQGGIAAVWDSSDDFTHHASDTRDAGRGLCDQAIVDLVVREGPQRVRELIEWGTCFDTNGNGGIDLTREGGHSFHRILHALGDATGREIIRSVLTRVQQMPNSQIFEDCFLIDLLTAGGQCVGALTWLENVGIQAIWAKQTILATGGGGQLFRETTNPRVATADGLAVAYRAGVELQDLEFVQFHPTVLYVAGSSRSLITEAVRGEGAYLVDKNGDRFLPSYHPMAELAPRDEVARAIVQQMAKTNHPCVYLDQSHRDPDQVRSRFPGITQTCKKFGLDFALDRIPVRPGAHYFIGGVRTDEFGQTSLPRLWAAGEVAATGLHGANRLASNSLLEALVFGHRCGVGASRAARDEPENFRAPRVEHHVDAPERSADLDLVDIRNALTSLLFRDAGIDRSATGLEGAAESVDFWARYVLAQEFDTPEGWELQNMLTVAGVMIRAALERTETRGTHNRSDYPQPDDAWLCHLVACPQPFFRFERRGNNGRG